MRQTFRGLPSVQAMGGGLAAELWRCSGRLRPCGRWVWRRSWCWSRDTPVPQLPTSLLRLAVWRAAHDGVGGVLIDPVSRRPRPWIEVMGDLVSYVHDSLEGFGDLERVEVGIDRLTRVGTGATAQRRTYTKTGQLIDVVAEAVRRTAGH